MGERPSTSGWYWFQMEGAESAEVVRVLIREGTGSGYALRAGDGRGHPLTELCGDWLGPAV